MTHWIALALSLTLPGLAAGQDKGPKVYLDCSAACDEDYLKIETKFADFVHNAHDAEVHVIIVSQNTNGGQHYSLRFVGRGASAGQEQERGFDTQPQTTEDETRKQMARVLKIGLLPYVKNQQLVNNLSVSFTPPADAPTARDPWDHWVFKLHGGAHWDGASSTSGRDISGSVSADRVTQEWRIDLGANANSERNSYKIEDQVIVSENDGRGVSGTVIKSLSDHWSAGVWASANHSTFGNQALNLDLSPSVEYNLFPYKEATRRQLRVGYSLGPSWNRYIEKTVYGKTAEMVLEQSLKAALELKQVWGSVTVQPWINRSLDEFKTGTTGLHSRISYNLAKGFTLDLSAYLTKINGQRALSAQGATRDEVLLHTRELASTFQRSLNFGVSYTFGSTNNNIVNPRFGY